MERTEKRLYLVISSMLAAMIVGGFIIGGLRETAVNLLRIQATGARLIQDFTVTHPQAALVNAALVGVSALSIVFFSSIHLSGPTFAAIMTATGFGLFGNTPFNSIPIMMGVWIAAAVAHKSLGAYSIIAIFGTALGPLVTFVAFELFQEALWAIPLGLLAGLAVGFLLPAVAGSLLILHQGYNLYNVGFSCGFLGLFIAAVLKAANRLPDLTIVWNTGYDPSLFFVMPVFGLFLIVCGLIMNGKGTAKQALEGFRAIQKLPGRLPSDFVDMVGGSATLLNMGVLAVGCWIYAAAVGAPLNGPVIGGIFTVMGFGGFGKTLRNCWPVMAGTIGATLLFGKPLTAPGPILAALFCTTLAPVAGQFGIIAGLLAGFVHLAMVETTAAWHAGLDLYNNGFAGGLTASLFLAFLQWYRTNRPREDFKT